MVPNRIVKKLILGSAQFGEKYGINNPGASVTKKEALKILNFAKYSGIKMIDLADKYRSYNKIFNTFGLSNWIVSMKISSDKIKNMSEVKFNSFFFNNLNYINKKKIEYLFFHNSSFLRTKNARLIFNYLTKLKKNGLIKKIGVSVYEPGELLKILENFKIDVVQLPLNIFDRRFCASKYVKIFKSKKIEVHARSIFLQGLLISKKEKLKKKYFKKSIHLNKWFNYLRNNNKNPIFECLNFVLKKKFVSKIVFGVNKLDHIKLIMKNLEYNSNTESLDNFHTHDIKLIDPRKWKKIR